MTAPCPPQPQPQPQPQPSTLLVQRPHTAEPASAPESLSPPSPPPLPADTLGLLLRRDDVELAQLRNAALSPLYAEAVCCAHPHNHNYNNNNNTGGMTWHVQWDMQGILYGALLCALEALRVVAVLPLAALLDAVCLAVPPLRAWLAARRQQRGAGCGWDATLFGMFVVVATLLTFIDSSALYHAIRGQSTLKLYVIYNFLEIVDRLLSALGTDAVRAVHIVLTGGDGAGGTGGGSAVGAGVRVVAACAVLAVHAVVLFVQTMVLNVTVNSQPGALVALLVSNNAVELKGAVMKRFDAENLLQLTCADACERCQLALVLLVVAVHNVSSPDGLPAPGALLEHPHTLWLSARAFAVVWATECSIDWTKHLFVAKFNALPVRARRHLVALFCADARAFSRGSRAPFLTQRLGFVPLPLCAVCVRVVLARAVLPSTRPVAVAAAWYAAALVLYLLLRSLVLSIASLSRQRYVCYPPFPTPSLSPFLTSLCPHRVTRSCGRSWKRTARCRGGRCVAGASRAEDEDEWVLTARCSLLLLVDAGATGRAEARAGETRLEAVRADGHGGRLRHAALDGDGRGLGRGLGRGPGLDDTHLAHRCARR